MHPKFLLQRLIGALIKSLVVSHSIEYRGEFLSRLNQWPLVLGDSDIVTVQRVTEDHERNDLQKQSESD